MKYPSLLIFFALMASLLQAQTRIKDITDVQGLGQSQLVGLGLVTGLDGEGDSSSSPLLQYFLRQWGENEGMELPEKEIGSRNAAVVSVSALLPAFGRSGEALDVTVASVGDSRNLEGGILITTQLKGADGEVYASAQGPLLISSETSGPKNRARIPRGAIITRSVSSQYLMDSQVTFLLHHPDFATAGRIREALQSNFGDLEISIPDPGSVRIRLQGEFLQDPASFLSMAEVLSVSPDIQGRVVIDPQSGVVVMGPNVRIAPVAVSVRGARILIGQNDPFSGEMESQQFAFEETSTVDELVTLLQGLGLETDNIIEVLEAIDRAGALMGVLEIL